MSETLGYQVENVYPPTLLWRQAIGSRLARAALIIGLALPAAACGSADVEAAPVSAPGSSAPSNPETHSVFFSPYEVPTGIKGIKPADTSLPLNSWKSSVRCSPDRAAVNVPEGTTSLSGWSLGRLGVLYFLQTAEPAKLESVRSITLFDPGNADNFTGGGCDENIDGPGQGANGLLADWIADSNHHLTIFSGEITEDKVDGQATFNGIRRYYLAQIIGQPAASQLLICDYPDMAHEDVLLNFASAGDNPADSCPTGPNDQPANVITFAS